MAEHAIPFICRIHYNGWFWFHFSVLESIYQFMAGFCSRLSTAFKPRACSNGAGRNTPPYPNMGLWAIAKANGHNP